MNIHQAIFFVLTALCFGLPTAQAADTPDNDTLQTIDTLLRDHVAQSPMPGMSVVLVQRGHVVFARGYGVEVAGSDRPMTAQSSVGIGSLTKSFTALAVMQLVEQGRVDLDDPVVKYVPSFRTADETRSQQVTVGMLLSNTSGLPSLDMGWIMDLDPSHRAMERLVESLSRYKMRREPGTSFEYANEGWALLGVLIENVTGQRYADYMQQRVFDPLNMTRTTTDIAQFEALDALHGHTFALDKAMSAQPNYQGAGMPAGSMLHASAEDLGRYLAALLAGGIHDGQRVVSQESIRTLWTPRISAPSISVEDGGTGEPTHYALGWMVDEFDGRTVVHHAGQTMTMTAEVFLEPETGTAVGILTNCDSLDPYRFTTLYTLANNLLHQLNGRPISRLGIPRRSDPTIESYDLQPDLLDRYTGTWLSPNGGRLQIDHREVGLVATHALGSLTSHYQIDFASQATLSLRNAHGTIRAVFRLTPNGIAHELRLGGPMDIDPFRRSSGSRNRVANAVSPDGRWSIPVPGGWTVQFHEGGFRLTSVSTPALSVSGAFTSASPERFETPPTELVHIETIGGHTWQETTCIHTDASGVTQQMRFHSERDREAIDLLASAPEGRLTEVIRQAVNPLLRGMEVPVARLD